MRITQQLSVLVAPAATLSLLGLGAMALVVRRRRKSVAGRVGSSAGGTRGRSGAATKALAATMLAMFLFAPVAWGQAKGTAPLPYEGGAGGYETYGPGWDGPGQGSVALSYYFANSTADMPTATQRSEMVRALGLWSKYADITWTQTASAGQSMGVDIGWYDGSHGDDYPFDGPGGVLAHAYYPNPPNPEPIAGDLHFDDGDTWTTGYSSDINLFTVGVHELGHSLALGHSGDDKSIMYAYYSGGAIGNALTPDDIAGIRSVYAARYPTFSARVWGTHTWRGDLTIRVGVKDAPGGTTLWQTDVHLRAGGDLTNFDYDEIDLTPAAGFLNGGNDWFVTIEDHEGLDVGVLEGFRLRVGAPGDWKYLWTAETGAIPDLGTKTAYIYDAVPDPPTPFNGGFERADFIGWQTSIPTGAEGVVVAQHIDDDGDPWNPTEGAYFARLRTDGPGSFAQVGHKLTVDAGDELEFDWFFDAGDEAPYNDHLKYEIADGNGTIIYSATLASVTDGGIVVGDRGETGWHRETYTFAAGGSYTFTFGIANIGDAEFESYAGLDNLMVVPEPATLLLLGAALPILLRRKSKRSEMPPVAKRSGDARVRKARPVMSLRLAGLGALAIVVAAIAPASFAGSVGPGPYGYLITDEVDLVWEDISGSGTRILAGEDDGHTYVPDIGFDFDFMGGVFHDVSISSNGTISLGQDGSQSYTNGPIPSSGFNNFIAVFWDDLINIQDAVYYETRGVPGQRRFIVQWNLVDHFSSTPQTATFSATLHEADGNITLQYPDTSFGTNAYDYGISATVGIQKNPTTGLQWSYNTPAVPSRTELLITSKWNIDTINATDLDSDFTPIGGDHGKGIMTISDQANIVVEGEYGQISYDGGSFLMTASLFNDTSSGGTVRGEFRGGQIVVADGDGNDMLLGTLIRLDVEELNFPTMTLLAGAARFEVTGGYLANAFGQTLGDVVQISFNISPSDMDDFSLAFTGASNVTLSPIPEPATLSLFALGGLALIRRRRLARRVRTAPLLPPAACNGRPHSRLSR